MRKIQIRIYMLGVKKPLIGDMTMEQLDSVIDNTFIMIDCMESYHVPNAPSTQFRAVSKVLNVNHIVYYEEIND
jgi:hypothetical protein